MQIAIGSDHAGRHLRLILAEHLQQSGHEVIDYGTDSDVSCDYPVYAEKVARSVVDGGAELGVLVCGSGVGMSMAANKVAGVRAALCFNAYMGEMTRAHNNANVLCLGERVIGEGSALAILDAFVATPFEGGRHSRRVDLIADLENS